MIGGNRIEPTSSGSGKGNAVIGFSQWQSRLRIGCTEGSITFTIKNEEKRTETFTIHAGERFNEEVIRFKELNIVANDSSSWQYTGYIDLDSR